MKKFLGKTMIYGLLIAIALEILVRGLHLYFEYPMVTLGQNDVVHYVPGQEGHFVTGNRRMNFTKYKINSLGFNSYREFQPTNDHFEIALIGDSFIEGLHQDYDNSIGKKIERKLSDSVKVFEFGFSGYDLADELHLISQMKTEMELIDVFFIYLKFNDDIRRDTYAVHTRANLEKNIAFKAKREVKLLSYLKGIGILAPLSDLPKRIKGITGKHQAQNQEEIGMGSMEKKYLDNLHTLLKAYPIDKKKSVFLIDRSITSDSFIEYCDSLDYKYLDFGKVLVDSETNTIIKYDKMKHWNDHGRDLIANQLVNYIINQY